MVYVEFDERTGAHIASWAVEPIRTPGSPAVRAVQREFATWQVTDWDPVTQDAKRLPDPLPPYLSRTELLTHLTSIEAALTAIKGKTDKLP